MVVVVVVAWLESKLNYTFLSSFKAVVVVMVGWVEGIRRYSSNEEGYFILCGVPVIIWIKIKHWLSLKHFNRDICFS